MMQKKPQQISYTVAKTAYGIYLVNELRQACGKELPTETDVKKFLLRINPSITPTDLQTARQISRYCQTNKDYIREAREETLDKVAKALNVSIKNMEAFREKTNPLLKAFKYYSHYIDEALVYLQALEQTNAGEDKRKFQGLFSADAQTKTYLSMISYHFGEENKDLPAISFGAESDLKTERILIELFDEYGLLPPQYMPENILLDSLDKQPAKTNFIAIGLFGNRLTGWMHSNNYLNSSLNILPGEKCLQLNGKKYYANRDNGIDYALFCKIALSNNSTVFIIGGIEGFGTQQIGEYLRDSWLNVYNYAAGRPAVTLLFETGGETKLVEQIL